jgi:predicted 3-demethylubiquinone-9 3-methyltransferase (glyoxalase superfamily)
MQQKITTFLTFNDSAEEAAKFYCGIFRNSAIRSVNKYPDSVPGMGGKVMSVVFELEGQTFHALNGGPHFTFSEGISLFIDCKTQEEVDHYWSRLTDGGSEQPCGWLKDRYGVSWQVVPEVLGRVLSSGDASRSKRVVEVMMQMKKLDVAKLEAAARG